MEKIKKKNKLLVFVIFLFIVAFIIFALWYKLENRNVYIPDIPNSHNLSSISYELETGNITVMTEEEMDKILNGIYELNLSTKSESIQDYPTKVEDIISIKLYYKEEDSVGIFYIYRRKNKYYFEEPYNGVYKISEGDYNYIISLIKE